MEFLHVWILSGNVLDSGLRYDDAASFYASAQNSGMELKGIGLSGLQFTRIPVSENEELKLLISSTPRSSFPF
ncbi:hypothetical protein OAD94_06650 [Amylibacter sp.]|nr:hypothetical protein [Amylibacter sp.]